MASPYKTMNPWPMRQSTVETDGDGFRITLYTYDGVEHEDKQAKTFNAAVKVADERIKTGE